MLDAIFKLSQIKVQKVSGSIGSEENLHFDDDLGFWCINDEQPKDQD